MTVFERPSPDLDKIVTAWRTWATGGDDVLAGRTMADLKIAGVDRMLGALDSENEIVQSLAERWSAWERGKVGPNETLAALESSGFDDIVEALTEPA